jgi:hypothetical protein
MPVRLVGHKKFAKHSMELTETHKLADLLL